VIKVHLVTPAGAVVYLNPQHIERVYVATDNLTGSHIVLTTGVPDLSVTETNEQVVYSIQASNRAG
jgi:hypothetical protein